MKPIIFNTEMVKANLEERKWQTRRLIKMPPIKEKDVTLHPHKLHTPGMWGLDVRRNGTLIYSIAPFKQPYMAGDIIYVRETWCDPTPDQSGWPILYKADMPMHCDAEDTECGIEITLREEDYKWRPSIHMPKEIARIFRRVTEVSMAQLQDITAEDCAAEGVPLYAGPVANRESYYLKAFQEIWNSTIKPADLPDSGWTANPLVWVIKYELSGDPRKE